MVEPLSMTDFYPDRCNGKAEEKPATQESNVEGDDVSGLTPGELARLQRKAEVISALKQGVSPTEIAKKMGLDRGTVYDYLREWVRTDQALDLLADWYRLLGRVEDDEPGLALQVLTRFVVEVFKQQSKVDVNQNIQVNISSQVDSLIQFGRERRRQQQQQSNNISSGGGRVELETTF